MQIFGRTADGTTVVIECDLEDTIASIKQKIHIKTGIPSDYLLLVCSGEELQDHQTVKDHYRNIKFRMPRHSEKG